MSPFLSLCLSVCLALSWLGLFRLQPDFGIQISFWKVLKWCRDAFWVIFSEFRHNPVPPISLSVSLPLSLSQFLSLSLFLSLCLSFSLYVSVCLVCLWEMTLCGWRDFKVRQPSLVSKGRGTRPTGVRTCNLANLRPMPRPLGLASRNTLMHVYRFLPGERRRVHGF